MRYLHYNAAGEIIGSGFSGDGTLPESCVFATDEQVQNAENYRVNVSSGEILELPADQIAAKATANLSAAARIDRDSRISSIQWRVQRYEQQLAAGIATTETADKYKALLTYVQALRDVPEQPGFPQSIDWPVEP